MSIPASDSVPEPQIFCQVCGQKARGKHYGAVACRACAAFFRRSGCSENVRRCKAARSGAKCEFFKNGFFNCKKCRLDKCFAVGMTPDDFQYDRDTFNPNNQQMALRNKRIPPNPRTVKWHCHVTHFQTMDTFLGRPNFIIFCAPSPSSSDPKNYLDVQFLLDKAMSILDQGFATPVTSRTKLGKMAIGLRKIHSVDPPDPRLIKKYGKEETLANWEGQMLKVTTWLSCFDDFRELPQELQLEMLKGIWQVWNRLELLAITVIAARKELTERQLRSLESDAVLGDWSQMDIDMTWCSRHTVEELKFFIDIQTDIKYDELFRLMFELEPTDVELSYMLCQLCFHYVGKRYQGRILDVSERFLELIGDELHSYYVEEQKRPHYGGRVATMMKINNRIQQQIYTSRSRRELAVIFDVFNLEFSHPEMFID